MQISEQQIKLSRDKFKEISGITIYTPDEGTLDDYEQSRYDGFVAALEAALSTDAEPVKTAPSVAVKALKREDMAQRLFATDWPNDKWDRFKDGDHAKERYLRMADTALSAQVQDVAGWRAIETAPSKHDWLKTHGKILLGRWYVPRDENGEPVDEGQWTWVQVVELTSAGWHLLSSGFVGWHGTATIPVRDDATHWMPLPAAPVKQEGQP